MARHTRRPRACAALALALMLGIQGAVARIALPFSPQHARRALSSASARCVFVFSSSACSKEEALVYRTIRDPFSPALSTSPPSPPAGPIDPPATITCSFAQQGRLVRSFVAIAPVSAAGGLLFLLGRGPQNRHDVSRFVFSAHCDKSDFASAKDCVPHRAPARSLPLPPPPDPPF